MNTSKYLFSLNDMMIVVYFQKLIGLRVPTTRGFLPHCCGNGKWLNALYQVKTDICSAALAEGKFLHTSLESLARNFFSKQKMSRAPLPLPSFLVVSITVAHVRQVVWTGPGVNPDRSLEAHPHRHIWRRT